MTRTGSHPRIGFPALAALAVAVTLAGLPAASAAGDPAIRAQVSADTVGIGEQATYVLTIENADGGQLEQPSFGELVVQGPSKSEQSSYQFMNGQASSTVSITYSWAFEAPHEGHFTISPAVLTINGRTLKSNSVDITCSGQAPARQPQQQPRSIFQSLQQQLGIPDDPLDNQGAIDRPRGDSDVFVRAVLDRTEAYVGQQVTLSLLVYERVDAGVVDMSVPKLDGFWSEELESQPQSGYQTIGGVQYRVILLRRLALFPLHDGELTVDSLGVTLNVAVSFFADQVKRKTDPVKLKVKPLPVAGRPPDFEASNVGAFRLTATASPTTVPLGQPVQLKVTLEGVGNIKSVRVPKPQLPEGLKTYDPTITDKVQPRGGRYGGTKTIEWIIVPDRSGDFTIPPIALSMFDPEKGAYTTTQTAPVAIHVAAGAAPGSGVSASGQVSAPAAANVLSGGIRPIRLQVDLTGGRAPLWRRAWFWPLTAAPLLLWTFVWCGGLVLGARRRRDPVRLQQKRARSVASRRLRAARERLDANDAGGFYAEITRALQQFVADKTGVSALGLTRDELGRTLADRGCPAGKRDALVHILERCETARFSPLGSSPDEMAKLLEEANRVIDELESVTLAARVA